MTHGSQFYFVERARNARRVSALSAGVSLFLLAALLSIRVPPVREALRDLGLPVPMRFGFEGPEQYVRRIILESEPGPMQGLGGMNPVTLVARRGGERPTTSSTSPHAAPRTRPVRSGEGTSEEDLLALARERYRRAPVMQSEDLVIEQLVRPEYPEEARVLGLEGRVALVALVDTTGTVVDVDPMGGGAREFQRAAAEAVRQCRFRPYLVNGRPHEVYAVFRFNFLLD